MKKIIVIALGWVLASSCFASLLPAETREIGLSGVIDFDTPSGRLIDLNVFGGYFIADYLEIGLKGSYRDDDDSTFWSIGPHGEYNFDIGTELVPYLGLSLDYAHCDYDALDSSDSALVIGFQAGAKYFITEYFALDAAFVFEHANSDLYASDDDLKNHDERIELGVRYFF